MLESNNHGFLKIKVLSLMMPWMTRQRERQVSHSQRHLNTLANFFSFYAQSDIHKTFGMDGASMMSGKVTTKRAHGMKLFEHFVSPQHRRGNVAIGKRRDAQLSHGAEERKQFLQSILGSLMQFDRRKTIQLKS